MPNVLVNDEYLSDIADAIRAKNGSSDTYTPGQMAGAIGDIEGGGGGGSAPSIEYIISPEWLDKFGTVGDSSAINYYHWRQAYAVYIGPILYKLKNYNSTDVFKVQYDFVDRDSGNTTHCLYRGGYNIIGGIYMSQIEPGKFDKLVIKTEVAYDSNWHGDPFAEIVLCRDFGFNSSSQPGANRINSVILATVNKTAAWINGQSGVTINCTTPGQLSPQTVTIDLSSINEAFYVGFDSYDCITRIRDMHLE